MKDVINKEETSNYCSKVNMDEFDRMSGGGALRECFDGWMSSTQQNLYEKLMVNEQS